MKKGLWIISMCLMTVLLAAGCGSSTVKDTQTDVQSSALTYGNVEKEIRKGQTNQAEVLRLLGNPNIITKNRDGYEVWTYTRQSYDTESGSFGGGILLFGGGKAFSTASTRSFDLILEWSDEGVVKNYTVVSTQF